MGAMLTNPVELIQVQRSGNEYYRAAAADMQGWRNGHEDGHAINSNASLGSFWVLDGHGGAGCAKYCSPKLGEEFARCPYADDERIESGFLSLDRAFREYCQENTDQDSGSTVIGSVVSRQDDGTYNVKLVNCGDSRGLIVFGPDASDTTPPLGVSLPAHLIALGSRSLASPAGAVEPEYEAPNKAGNPRFSCRWPIIAETVDHKPSHETENARIIGAGGFVSMGEPARLDGNLAVSRGLGDFEYKSDQSRSSGDQKCSNVPDIYEAKNVPAGSFIVLACDGLWDVCSGEYVAKVIREELKKDPKADLGEIATELIRYSLCNNSRDNVTVLIVQLANGSEWTCVSDEMKGFSKILDDDDRCANQLDDEVRRQYMQFLNRCAFPEKPVPCSICKRWFREMWQCHFDSSKVYFCSKSCQKKGWKKQKAVCSVITGKPESS